MKNRLLDVLIKVGCLGFRTLTAQHIKGTLLRDFIELWKGHHHAPYRERI